MSAFRNFMMGAALLALAACTDIVIPVSEEKARERLQQGLEEITLFNYAGAQKLLAPVPLSLPEGSLDWQKGVFGLASAYRYRQPVAEASLNQAVAWFELAVEKGPDANIKALALLELGRIDELQDFPGDEKNVEQARATYQRVLDEYPDTLLAAEAQLRLAGTYFKQFDQPEEIEKGVTMLRAYLEAHPDNKMAVVMWQVIAQIELRQRENQAAALEAYEEARKLGFAVPVKNHLFMWQMCLLAESLNKPKKAVEYYQRLITETPRSKHGTLARLRLEELAREHPEWQIEIPERPTYFQVGGQLDEKDEGETREGAPASTPAEAP